MSLFLRKAKSEYSLLLDIGSGSVSLTVVQNTASGSIIVWQKKERLILKTQKNIDQMAKQIMSVVAEVMMYFYKDGVPKLQTTGQVTNFSTLQVSMAAPFAHTISKKISYTKEKPFLFTNQLQEDLIKTAQDKMLEEEKEVAGEVALVPTARVLLQKYLNGYPIDNPQKTKVTSLNLALSTTFIHEYMYKELLELQEKLFPKAEMRTYSFVLMLYYVLKDIHPEMQEYCIINQTLEATELAVIRDGVITFASHDGYGIANLIAEIAEILHAPMEDTFSSIQGDVFTNQYNKLSKEKQKKIDKVLEEYEQRIVDLLQQTGDGFTIPKSIFLHTASCTYDFFATRIERGAEKSTGFGHIVHNLDNQTLGDNKKMQAKDKTCVELVSTYFFNKCAEVVRYKEI